MIRLSQFLYNLFLLLSAPGWLLYFLLLPKTRRGVWQKRQKVGFYPKELWQALGQLSQQNKPVLWIHAVSVGEFNAIRSLALQLSTSGRYAVAVSTTTATGQRLAQSVLPDDIPVFYFPFDFWPLYQKLFRQLKPQLILLTETELWPNLVFYTQRGETRPVPIVLINGRLSLKSFKGYRWIKTWLMQDVLQLFERFCMQSQGDADRLVALGAPPHRIQVTGNIKFDLKPQVTQQQIQQFRTLFQIPPHHGCVMTAASTHAGEEEMMLEIFQRVSLKHPDARLILAPRHPERVESICRWMTTQKMPYALRSALTEQSPACAPVIILDTIGELMPVFGLSDFVLMGGSFVEKGGHNLLEPLAMQVPVIFGPHMFNFQEISDWVLSYQAGVQVSTIEQASQAIETWLTNPSVKQATIESGQQLLNKHRGAQARLVQVIHEIVPPATSRPL